MKYIVNIRPYLFSFLLCSISFINLTGQNCELVNGVIIESPEDGMVFVCKGSTLSLLSFIDFVAPSNDEPCVQNLGNITYEWFKESQSLSGDFINACGDVVIPNVDESANGIYTISLDCNEKNFTASVTVEVIDITSLSINSSSTSICQGESVELTATFTDGSIPNVSYLWSTTNQEASITVFTPATYSVTATLGECTETASITISESEDVPRNLTVTPMDAAICSSETITLTAEADNADSFLWSNGATTSTITVGPGEYIVTAFKNGCPIELEDEVIIASLPSPTASISPQNLNFCLGENLELTVNTNASTINWSSGEMTPSISVSTGGSYSVEVTNENNCSVTRSVEVPNPTPVPVLPDQSEQTIPSGEFSNIAITIEPGISISWELVETINLSSPSAGLTGTNQFIQVNPAISQSGRALGGLLFLVTPIRNGCEGEPVKLFVNVVPDVEAPFIPEVFSPNGDGVNDTWMPVFPEGVNFEVTVYSRSGALVYEGTQSSNPWDGSECLDGAYYYRILNTDTGDFMQGAISIVGKQQ